MNKRWTYTIISARRHGASLTGEDQTAILNLAGENCWELVSVIPQSDGDVWFYLKSIEDSGHLHHNSAPVAITFHEGFPKR